MHYAVLPLVCALAAGCGRFSTYRLRSICADGGVNDGHADGQPCIVTKIGLVQMLPRHIADTLAKCNATEEMAYGD